MISRGEIAGRFDAFFWQPKFHAIDAIFEKRRDWVEKLGSIAHGLTNGDHGGVQYTESGIRYLRGQSVTNLGLDLDKDSKFISEVEHKRMIRAEVVKGDVLFTIAGSIGNACVVNGVEKANINQALVRVKPGFRVLAQYLSDFLNSSIGKLQSRRIANGGVQLNINFSEVKALKVLLPPLPIQEKVVLHLAHARDAYRLAQEQAAGLLRSVDDYVLSELGIKLPPEPANTIASRMFKAHRKELTGWRFDPEALHPEREGCVDALQRLDSLSLKSACFFVRDLRTEIPDGIPYIGLENIESNTGRYVPSTEKDTVSSAFAFRKGQVLFPKLRPYLNKVFLAPFDGLCSTEFHVLEGRSVRSDFLALFLRSQIVVKQTKHLMSGNTLPRLQTEDIEGLLVPVVDLVLQEKIVSEANRRMIEAERLLLNAEVELNAAQHRIEAMLLGEAAE